MSSFNPISGAPISSGPPYSLINSLDSALSLSDTLVANVVRQCSLESTLSVSHATVLNTVINFALSDTTSLSHSVDITVVKERSVESTLSLSQDIVTDLYSNTSRISSLSLTHSVGAYTVRFPSVASYVDLSQNIYRILPEAVSNTLTFSTNTYELSSGVSVSNDLSLSHVLTRTGLFGLQTNNDLTLSGLANRSISVSNTDALTLTHVLIGNTVQQQNPVSVLGITHGVTYTMNLNAEASDGLTFSHEIHSNNFRQSNQQNTLYFSDSVNVFNLSVQNPASSMGLAHILDGRNLPICYPTSSLSFTASLIGSNFQQQNDASTLAVNQTVGYRIVRNAPHELVDSMNLTATVSVNQVSNQSICQCIHLTADGRRVKEETVDNDLSLGHYINFGQPFNNLELSHTVVINAAYDPCCGSMFIQGKFALASFSCTQSLGVTKVSGRQITHTITPRHTVAVYKV